MTCVSLVTSQISSVTDPIDLILHTIALRTLCYRLLSKDRAKGGPTVPFLANIIGSHCNPPLGPPAHLYLSRTIPQSLSWSPQTALILQTSGLSLSAARRSPLSRLQIHPSLGLSSLVSIFAHHPVFVSTGPRLQAPPLYQIRLLVYRLSHHVDTRTLSYVFRIAGELSFQLARYLIMS